MTEPKANTETNSARFRRDRGFWLIMAWSAIFSLVVSLIVFGGCYYFSTPPHLLKAVSCGQIGGSPYCYFNKDWDADGYLSSITSFYGTIITILIALLTLVTIFITVFTLIVVKSRAYTYAESEIESQVLRYFETHKADEHLKKILKGFTSDYVQSSEFKDLKLQQEKLTKRVDDMDPGDDTIAIPKNSISGEENG